MKNILDKLSRLVYPLLDGMIPKTCAGLMRVRIASERVTLLVKLLDGLHLTHFFVPSQEVLVLHELLLVGGVGKQIRRVEEQVVVPNVE
jgi:hypothetical protein